ncbi:hypothetical protein BDZ89DRAFT_1149693 [Hymenopellis radicata]|nr:hypothetical protein BDZ89DRAFT_1149693 [Hymenopellis radicata]
MSGRPPTNNRRRTPYERAQGTDHPMKQFREEVLTSLMDGLRREAMPGLVGRPKCLSCGIALSELDAMSAAMSSTTPELFHCETCGEFLECKGCCLARHVNTPLHIVKRWNGEFWDRMTLSSMGYVYQLGHHGAACVHPGAQRRMTVIYVNGVHELTLRSCGCGVAEDLSTVEELLRNALAIVL